MTGQKGTVLCGANNIFLVRPWGAAGLPADAGKEPPPLECRIKGKILRGAEKDYNPLAAGDGVSFLPDAKNPRSGVLYERLERKNALLRWNKKGRAPQAIAANVDLLVCVTSPQSPPFRPRFLDRLLLAAAFSDIPALVCLNKDDQATTPEIEERLGDYEARNIPVLRTRTCAGDSGLYALRDFIAGKRVVFAGHSGVGKTSLFNCLSGSSGRKVGELSEKYNRGRHTTVLACLAAWAAGEIIDTPGVREFDICGVYSRDLRFFFSDFDSYAKDCRLPGCTHTHEPACAVREAAENGRLLFDRYESYCRVYSDLLRREKYAP
ncbi:MAG: ribosome small subunit-dependent GTPase A [Spirochaetales bacterium]|nr:ribosome small subunit-dependent GTPase A [Spirochaetales bacterium]